MWFDANAALKRSEVDPRNTATSAISATPAANLATLAEIAGNRMSDRHPDIDAFEERAAIAEFDGGLTRTEAEDFAAQAQGYDNVVLLRRAMESEQLQPSQKTTTSSNLTEERKHCAQNCPETRT